MSNELNPPAARNPDRSANRTTDPLPEAAAPNTRGEVILRPVTPADAEVCGRIVFEAFASIARQHNFPLDFASTEVSTGFMRGFVGHPAIFGLVAEAGGQVIACNFLDERSAVRGVGPMTVHPAHHGRGIGRRLMRAVLDRGRGSAGVRLVQDAFNTTSLSLYASLGFEVKEPLALMAGKIMAGSMSAGEGAAGSPPPQVRPLGALDLDACAALCQRVHGFDRAAELRDAMAMFRPLGLFRDGRLCAYASAPTLWPLNHGVGETEQDLKDLLAGASALNDEPLSLLVPTRRAAFFRWCLSAGLRVVKPMSLMAIGDYQEPRGGYYPSVEF